MAGLIRPVYLPVFMLSLSWTLVEPAFPQYLAGLGAGLAAVGTILAMRGFGQLASDLPGGVILARWGIRRVTSVSLAASILANLGLVATDSTAWIAALVFIAGLFSSVSITAFMSIVRVSVRADQRGRALSLAGGALRVGAFVGPAVGGLLADQIGMPAVFAARTVVLVVGLISFLRSSIVRSGLPAPAPRSFISAGNAVKEGLAGRWYAVGTVGAAVLVLMWLRAARTVILPLWGSSIGLSATLIGTIMSAGAAVELMVFIPAGMMMDRSGRKAVAGLCLGVFSAGLFTLVFTGGPLGFVVATVVIGLGNGFGAGINMTLGTDLAPSGAVSEFLGLWRLYGDLGMATGPIVVGALAGAFSLSTAILGTGILGIVGLIVMVGLAPETLHIASQEDGT